MRLSRFSDIRNWGSVALLMFITVCLAALIGCGGGTTGTGGGGHTRFLGVITSPQNTPLPGVVVTLLETGDSAITNQAGTFDFEAEFNTLELTLLLEKDNSQAQVSLGEIAPEATEVNLALEYDIPKNEAKVVSSETVTPTPTPRPEHEPTPFPQPTATPSDMGGNPTPQPTDTPIIEPEPTITETPTPTVIAAVLEVRGEVHASDSRVLNRARVTLSGGASGADQVSDNGEFNIMATLVGGETQVEFRSNLGTKMVSMGTIPSTAKRLRLLLIVTVQGQQQTLSIGSAQIEE